ncbi:hypothetical protein [Nonomuraea sp. NPDC050786]
MMAQPHCPHCRNPLDSGPVRYRCSPCRRDVYAAELDADYHAAKTAAKHR